MERAMHSNFKIIFFILYVISQACSAMDYGPKSRIINIGNTLDLKEIAYQERHTPLANSALKQFIGIPEELDIKMPKICICCSGGGVRAETATIGVLTGVQIIGLLPAINSIATLSGSAWAVIPWILHQMPPFEYSELLKEQLREDFWDVKDLQDCKTQKMINRIETGITNNVKARLGMSIVPALHKFGVSDLWGHLIARRLLYDLEIPLNRELTFKDIRRILKNDASYPFPIFTTLLSESKQYEGFEITPYMGYSNYLEAGISTKYLGSSFKIGLCTQAIPEKPVRFYMGVIGSAYTINANEAIVHLLQDLSNTLRIEDTFIDHVKSKLEYLLKKTNSFVPRNFDVKIPNYVYKMPEHKMKGKKAFHLLDYGINFNLPIFPFLRQDRTPDILIICDASEDSVTGSFTQLKNAKVFAKKHNMRFPSLKKYKDMARNFKIFYEDDPAVPVVIYIANTTKAFTLNMNYDADQFDSIFQPIVETIVDKENTASIINAIKFKTSQINEIKIPNNFLLLPNGIAPNHSCTVL